jgi:hypothetical protein
MCTVIEHDTLEISKVAETMGVKSSPKGITLTVTESLNKRDVVSKHPSCTHSGYCGTHAHGSGGGGWCYYCRKCNPR